MSFKLLLSVVAITFAASGAHATANLISNGSFESPALAAGQYVVPNSTYGGWTYTNGSSIGGNAQALVDNNQGPNGFSGNMSYTGFDGVQFAGIQADSRISQAFTATSTSALLTWLDAGRPSNFENGCCTGNQTYNVMLNDATVASNSTTTAQDFASHSLTLTGLVVGNSYTLAFAGQTSTDETSFIDNVSVTDIGAVPEPATWALMVGGFGLVGAAARRRRSVALAA